MLYLLVNQDCTDDQGNRNCKLDYNKDLTGDSY
jgi:hypothetical protein